MTDDPADDDHERRRRRRRVGTGLVVLAVVAIAVGVAVSLRGGDERPVGELLAADLPGTSAPGSATASTTTTAAGPVVTAPGTDGPAAPTTTAADPAATPPSTEADLGDRAQWPGPVRGRPEAFGADGDAPPADAGELADGAYLFFDQAGWHLWLVGGAGDASIEVVADQELARADAVGGAPDLQVDGNRLRLARGDEGAEVTGVDFSPGFYGKTMVVTVDGDLPLFTGSTAKAATPVLGLQLNRENR